MFCNLNFHLQDKLGIQNSQKGKKTSYCTIFIDIFLLKHLFNINSRFLTRKRTKKMREETTSKG